jgi:hypothetical protein
VWYKTEAKTQVYHYSITFVTLTIDTCNLNLCIVGRLFQSKKNSNNNEHFFNHSYNNNDDHVYCNNDAELIIHSPPSTTNFICCSIISHQCNGLYSFDSFICWVFFFHFSSSMFLFSTAFHCSLFSLFIRYFDFICVEG